MGRVGRFRLDGKVAVVTGGGSGIGAATCRAFAEQGARVVVADVSEAGGRAVADELGDPKAVFCRTDVTDLASLQAAVATSVERFGRLDVLVNNAGIGLVGSVLETDPSDWSKLIAVNMTGVFHGSRVAVRLVNYAGSNFSRQDPCRYYPYLTGDPSREVRRQQIDHQTL